MFQGFPRFMVAENKFLYKQYYNGLSKIPEYSLKKKRRDEKTFRKDFY